MDRYVFMTMAVGDGYGGLEHRASTALICARADLPTTASSSKEISDGYLQFSACAATSISTPGTSSASSRPLSRPTTCRRKAIRRCCGCSKASPATTTT
jgi:hypothetical protein